MCFLTGREIHDALGGRVPLGLISSNWGGTKVELWQPPESIKDCPGKGQGTLWNSMVAPYAVGPMALKGLTWCTHCPAPACTPCLPFHSAPAADRHAHVHQQTKARATWAMLAFMRAHFLRW